MPNVSNSPDWIPSLCPYSGWGAIQLTSEAGIEVSTVIFCEKTPKNEEILRISTFIKDSNDF